MLIFYADEYGDHSMTTAKSEPAVLKAGTSEFFILSAVGVRDTSRKPLAEALFDIKRKHFGESVADEPWNASEIKGRFLFRATRSVASGNVLASPASYQRLDSRAKVDGLITDLGLVFTKYRPLIFTVAVDKRELISRKSTTHPLGAAYAYIHQRIALTMEKLYAGDAAIVVADQQTQHEAFFRSGGLHASREAFPLKPNFNLVLDKPLWVDTDLSSWDREIIQLADIVAYTTAECMKRNSPPPEACYLWEQIRSCLAMNWSTGRILGGGFAVHPKSAPVPAL
ncbi:DUF3800 domain-containing protein [Leifsonia sp. C5G2]|uniref:DUF3800 domain-containing protein n=1 Tax=Leifsonia sp. C5G2 TaxID=2735269 RepID=UPI0017E55E46|nr:DUF3800 domain-containing protein [Leifsonia sp. C5G2]NUU06581.1 DUF3800 domain-containing protein [Leifsonia sp. C5G2]